MPGGRPKSDEKQRFLAKVKEMDSGCHEWQSTIKKDGYGSFYFRARQEQAHRAAYTLFVGEIPADKMVLHKCDNRKCVKLEHLYIGDAKQNKADKIERCQWWGNMKYGDSVIEECRRLYAAGMTQKQISELVGPDQTTVSKFIRRTFKSRGK